MTSRSRSPPSAACSRRRWRRPVEKNGYCKQMWNSVARPWCELGTPCSVLSRSTRRRRRSCRRPWTLFA
eukprot:3483062-Pyramimonas_sp.AAC.1